MRILLLTTTVFLIACEPKPTASPDIIRQASATEIMPTPALDADLSTRFSRLALDCVHKEFPNKVSRTTNTAEEMGTPREIFPTFYGCFDWHSSVHGHWLLVRLLRVGELDDATREEAIAKLDQSFSAENLSGELANFNRPARGSWERPYGWAWYLQLTAELREWIASEDVSAPPELEDWLTQLQPLEAEIVAATKAWLPKLAYPIHLGTHNQSAFAMTLMHDWAVIAEDGEFAELLEGKAMTFHADQYDCPLRYEPSGEDFLSACLMTADLMRRVMTPERYEKWVGTFLPNIPIDGNPDWLLPGVVLDASDGKLVHLDGVNSSRAWNLYNIARALPKGDSRIPALVRSAQRHQETGVAAVSDEHYSGSHWLASFATYLMTDRGQLNREKIPTTDSP